MQIGRRKIFTRTQSLNHKGLPEPNIRHLVRQVGVRCSFPSITSSLCRSVVSMADARRARAERRATLAAQTAPAGDDAPRRSPSPAANAATGLVGNEQQAASLHPLVRQDGRTATPSLTPAGSSSHARRAPMVA